MNYTKFVIFLIIFHGSVSLVSEMAVFQDTQFFSSDLTTVQNATDSVVDTTFSLWSAATYLVDAIWLGLKLTALAPYYTSLTLTVIGVHPAVAGVIYILNYAIYAMWLLDLKKGQTFF